MDGEVDVGGGKRKGGQIKPDLCHRAFVAVGKAVGGKRVGGGIVCSVRAFIGLSSSFLCVSILLRDYVL